MSPSIYLPFSNWSLETGPGESARGYFLRLVAEEGHYSTSVYANEVGINGRRLDAEETLETLLALPIPQDRKNALRRFSLKADGAYFQLAGQKLRQRQVGLTSRRFCPACLAAAPYHRAWWDILAFRTCPEHGTAVENTDAVGQPIGWWWADVASDTDGNPLGKRGNSNFERYRGTLEAFVLERLGMAAPASRPLLERYQLYEVIEACEYIGTWLGNAHMLAVPADQLANMNVGMAALKGTRDDLVSAMRAWFVDHVPVDLRREGKMASMGWAWKAWPKLPGTTIGDMLRLAASEAFEPVGKTGRKRYSGTADFYAEKALAGSARHLGVRMEALLPLARHLGIVDGRIMPWKLAPEAEDMLKNAVSELVPSAIVSGIIGFKTWDWKALVDAGILTPFPLFALGDMYLRTEVERMVGTLMAAAPLSGVSGIALRTYARRNGITVGDVLVEALQGRLATVRSIGDRPGLRSVSILATTRRKRAARHISGTPVPFTVAEASSILQLHNGVVALLVSGGRIATGDGGMLSRDSVLEFHKRYANAQLYRPVLGCASSMVRRLLEERGVRVERFGQRVANIVVERENARRALGLAIDPDVAKGPSEHDLWERFQELTAKQCPAFALPSTVPELGAKLRTATRKIAVDAMVDSATRVIKLVFDIHPELTARRWKLFEKNELEIRETLGFMRWDRSGDGAGWRLSFVAGSDEIGQAVRVLTGIYRWFR